MRLRNGITQLNKHLYSFYLLRAAIFVLVQAFRVKQLFAVWTVLQFSDSFTILTKIWNFSELNSFEEILGIVGLSSFSYVPFDREIKN